MKKYGALLFLVLLLLSSCGRKYDYTVHKPRVQYKEPDRKALKKLLDKQLGKPYVWAEEGPDAFDCSGLVYYCYASMNMRDIPRVARNQAKVGEKVSPEQLHYGDLIFFDTSPRRTGQITHVGIYVGNGKFQHAANEKEGVKITSLSKPYYRSRIKLCRRWLPLEPAKGAQAFKPLKPVKIAASKDCRTCYSLPKKVTATSGEWFIQVGSFRGTPDPKWLAHIRALGYDYRSILGGDGMKKLLVGPFRSKEEALQVLPNARHEFNPGSFIKHLPGGKGEQR